MTTTTTTKAILTEDQLQRLTSFREKLLDRFLKYRVAEGGNLVIYYRTPAGYCVAQYYDATARWLSTHYYRHWNEISNEPFDLLFKRKP